jgi:ATP-dependent helicase HrpB
MDPALPIHEIRDAIVESLRKHNRLVLTAPTGSGKTTQVPQMLLQSGLAEGRQVIILQPRRLAARLVAMRVAAELGGVVGGVVGYQTRHESRVGAGTVIRFMTEGLFLRLLQSNPALKGVGAVILDEFHERNIATDTSAAMVRMVQESTRPDLRLLVMSATLDVGRISDYLRAPALEAHGRMYPVQVSYVDRRTAGSKSMVSRLARPAQAPVWDLAAEALADIVDAGEEGDVLIFMPGAYEIRRTIEACGRIAGAEASIFPLYSELPAHEQDRALAPCAGRKVIVATNVAETSITIPGIRLVIDSGLARMNRFDPRRGINVLTVEPISQASADQRAGRAGRTGPGACIRLWPENEHRHRPAHTTPEIQRLDLAEVVLQLHALGVKDVRSFPWLEAPAESALQQALGLLRELGSLDRDTPPALTGLGWTMARLPMHPRLSRMLVEAAGRGCLGRATLWAALISERDIFIRGAENSFARQLAGDFPRSDLLVLESAMDLARRASFDPERCSARGLHASACREVDRTCRLYADACRGAGLAGDGGGSIQALAECLLVAFPDHLAQRRNPTNLACALAGGRRGQLDPDSVAQQVGLLLPVEIREVGGGQGAKTVLSLATEIHPDWLRAVHGGRMMRGRITRYNPATQAVEALDREVFEGLVLEESILPDSRVEAGAAAVLLAGQVLDGALKLERWDSAVDQWIERVRCVADWFPERKLIRYDEDDRRLIIEELCAGAIRYKDIRDRPVLPYFRNALSWEDQQLVEQMAPERLALPRGWRMRIEYSAGSPPRGRAKIQDLYGLSETPRIAGGRVGLLLEILGPNMRPIQVTDDLANFWEKLYPSIRRELSRRYPRHEWR